MRHWSEPLVLCIGAMVSLFYFTLNSPLHMRDGNWGLAMAHCNIYFWCTLLCAGGAIHTGTGRPLLRAWAIGVVALLCIAPETHDFVKHWLLR
jgi:hypothetical protein